MRDRILYANAKTLPLLLVLVIALLVLGLVGVPVQRPVTADFFHVTYAELEYEDGRWVVYSDGHTEATFEGSFRVCATDARTARHFWTCEWSDPIPYGITGTVGSAYRQPETLEWWANVTPPPDMTPDRSVVMTTCWRAVLGRDWLAPVCAHSLWEPPQAVAGSGTR